MCNPAARKIRRKDSNDFILLFRQFMVKTLTFSSNVQAREISNFLPFLSVFQRLPSSSSHVVTNKNYYSHKMGFSNKRQRFRQLDTISLNMVNVKIPVNELPLFGQKCEEKFSKRGKNQSKHTMFLYRMEGGGDEESGRV